MKKEYLFFVLFVFLNLFLGYTHSAYLDEHSSFVLIDDLVKNDYASYLEHYPMFCQTPGTQFISSFFKLLIPGIFGYRFFLVISHLLLFSAVFLICRLLKLSVFDSSFIAFFLSCAFPVLYIYHFVYAEPLSLLFFVLAFYFFLKKDSLNSSISSLISFLSKQIGVAGFSLVFYNFINKKIKTKHFVLYSIIIAVPLLIWIYFNFSTYGTFLAPCSHKLEFNPLILAGKAGWLVGMTGFYCLPFVLQISRSFFKSKKFVFLLVFILLPFSIRFFGSRSYTTETENFKIHGSIPLFYHILPGFVYVLFIFVIFTLGIFYLSSLKDYYAYIYLSVFLIICLLGGENQPIAETRHTVYLLPVIIFSLAEKYKLTKTSKLLMFLIVVYSFTWAFLLVSLADSSGQVKDYLSSLEDGSCYYSNLPIYGFESSCSAKNATYIVSAPGFSEKIDIEKYALNRTFAVIPKIYETKIYHIR